MYTFACSQRTVDIDQDEGFDTLFGDELSELLCEDPLFIRWMSPQDKEKLEGLDIATVLSKHPVLIGHFYPRMMDGRVMRKRDWKYLVSSVSSFKILMPRRYHEKTISLS